MKTLPRLILVGAAALMMGCPKEEEPKTQNNADDGSNKTSNTSTKSTSTASKNPDETSNVRIDDKIIKLCGDLPTAKFGFDSSEVSPEAQNVLDALARCFISGPAKGKGIRLVGHADNRGDTEYNLALGQRRAASIGGFLQKKGVEQGRIATSSQGEFEASGSDEAGWAADRKVEIFLAE